MAIRSIIKPIQSRSRHSWKVVVIILGLSDFKATKFKKELERTIKKITDLGEQLSCFDRIEIIDFIAAEKSSILKNFDRLKTQMYELYGLQDQYLDFEVYDRIMISICQKGVDNSEDN